LAGSSPAGGESPKADVAAAALAALVAGKEVVLTHAKAATDRHGRVLADAVLAPQSGPASVTKTLVEQGVVRVAGRSAGAGACLPVLRSAERSARSARLGLWGDPRYFPRTAEDVGTLSAEHGRFTLVEGTVVSVRESGGTIYVNFGQRWSEDFTVTILKRNERLFTAAGVEPRKLAGRRGMVRGGVGERGGPLVEAAGAGGRTRSKLGGKNEGRMGGVRVRRVGEKAERRHAKGVTPRLAAVLAATLALAACSGDRYFGQQPGLMAGVTQPTTAESEMSPATLREHQRILAAYGGAYPDSRLEAEVGATVNRLVAASERP